MRYLNPTFEAILGRVDPMISWPHLALTVGDLGERMALRQYSQDLTEGSTE